MTDAATGGRDEAEQTVDHLLCQHRWAPGGDTGAAPRCASCGLGYREYVEGEVRAALSRMGTWP